ncbi:hypothetical protein GCM10027440_26400 [Nocardiopsis coralliicola]
MDNLSCRAPPWQPPPGVLLSSGRHRGRFTGAGAFAAAYGAAGGAARRAAPAGGGAVDGTGGHVRVPGDADGSPPLWSADRDEAPLPADGAG